MKTDVIMNSTSTNGVMSLSGACFVILTLGMFAILRLRCDCPQFPQGKEGLLVL